MTWWMAASRFGFSMITLQFVILIKIYISYNFYVKKATSFRGRPTMLNSLHVLAKFEDINLINTAKNVL